jgi:hypothetical protein
MGQIAHPSADRGRGGPAFSHAKHLVVERERQPVRAQPLLSARRTSTC